MTASTGADRWPDEVVEAAAEAMFSTQNNVGRFTEMGQTHQDFWRLLARAALAVVPPDPVIAEIREIVDETETVWAGTEIGRMGAEASAYRHIAALLAGGESHD